MLSNAGGRGSLGSYTAATLRDIQDVENDLSGHALDVVIANPPAETRLLYRLHQGLGQLARDVRRSVAISTGTPAGGADQQSSQPLR
jgi:hypothetical protein